MIFGEGLFGLLLVFLWIYCILDVISSDASLVRNLPKLVWLVLVIIVPDVGSIAWLVLGRPRGARFEPGSTTRRRAPRVREARSSATPAPDDSPEFLRSLDDRRLRAWEDDLRRREEELRKRDDNEH